MKRILLSLALSMLATFANAAVLDFPSSPTVGQTYSANGKSWSYDGTSWVIQSGFPAPSFVGVKAYHSTTQSIPNNTDTAVLFDSETSQFDTGGMHSTSSNTSRITFVEAGYYTGAATVYFAPGGSGRRLAYWYKNGSPLYPSGIVQVAPDGTNGNYLTLPLEATYFVAGDYLEVIVFHTQGSSLNIGAASLNAQASSIAIYKTDGVVGQAALASTHVGYGSGAGLLTGEAAFNYNETTNLLTVGGLATTTFSATPATNKSLSVSEVSGYTTPADISGGTGGVALVLSRPNDGSGQHAIYTYNTSGGAWRMALSARQDMVFQTGGGLSAAPERMRILDGGNVGIGIVAPTEKLHVASTSSTSAFVHVEGAINTVGAGAGIRLSESGTGGQHGGDFYYDSNFNTLGLRTYSGSSTAVERLTILRDSGRFGIGLSPTAMLHLPAGTTAASTAPLKFNSGSLMTTAEAGAVEFLTDKFYGTITTGAARKEFTLNDAALTSGRVPFVTTNGRLTDSTNLTYDSTNNRMTASVSLNSGSYLTWQNSNAGTAAYAQLSSMNNQSESMSIYKLSSAYTTSGLLTASSGAMQNTTGSTLFLNSASADFIWTRGGFAATNEVMRLGAGTLSLGVAGTTLGSIALKGNTSGSYALTPNATATSLTASVNQNGGTVFGVSNTDAGASASARFDATSDVGTTRLLQYGSGVGNWGVVEALTGLLIVKTAAAQPLIFQTNGTNYARILGAAGTGSVAGNFGLRVLDPTAYLQIAAGTATAGTAPLKLTSGTNLTTPEAGAFEFDGTSLHFTPSTVRNKVVLVPSGTVTMGACGTSPSVVGTDLGMIATVGSGGSATDCVVTFATTAANAPACTANSDTDIVPLKVVTTTTTATITASAAFTAGSKLHVTCHRF